MRPTPLVPTAHSPVAAVLANDFDRGPGYVNWRPTGSGDWLLIYTVRGAGLVGLPQEKSHRLTPGDALLYAPGAMQSYRTDPESREWRLLWAHFQPRPHWRAWLRWPEIASCTSCISVEAAEVRHAVQVAMRRMIGISRRAVPGASDLALNALEEALLWLRAAAHDAPWSQVDARVRRAMDYLAEHLREPFRLEGLARHCGLSISRLGHLFKDELGISPQRYSEELRLAHAQQLLSHTSLSVREIADETGFTDAAYFTKRFRHYTRASPSDWRAKSPGTAITAEPAARVKSRVRRG